MISDAFQGERYDGPGGLAGILAQEGDLSGAMQMRQMGQQLASRMKADADERELLSASIAYQIATEHADPVARFEAVQRAAPYFTQKGIDFGELSGPEQFSDDALGAVGTYLRSRGVLAADKPEGGFTLSPGQMRFDARGNPIASGGEPLPAPMTDYQRQSLDLQRRRLAGAAGEGGGVQTMSPQEIAAMGLPEGTVAQRDGRGKVSVIQRGGQTVPMVFGADARARIVTGLPQIIMANSRLSALETESAAAGKSGNPYSDDKFYSAIRNVPLVGQPAAKGMGRESTDRYQTAAKQFEASVLPILSGAAVTDSEAERSIRAMLPQYGDRPSVLEDKAIARKSMANAFAAGLNQPIPYPDAPLLDFNDPTKVQSFVSSVLDRFGDDYGEAAATGGEGSAGVYEDSALSGQAPPGGVEPEIWEYMTPEERALFR
jgi:hypothetical protein